MIWNPSEGITIGGFTLRFYSLMFVIAFGLGYYIMKKVYERENRTQDELDKLFFYTFIATLLGARLGHVFFYDWDYYKDHLSEILLPFRFSPEFEFTGFSGLASHGAAIAIILVMFYYSKKIIKKPLLWILDRVVLSVTIGGVFVRFGNFFNSEIYGHIVDKAFPFGVKFIREDEFWQANNLFGITQVTDKNQAYSLIQNDPRFASILEAIPFRHPTQLYEAFGYVILFAVLMLMYWKTDARNYLGKIFGVFLVFLWMIRFVVEYVKESQGGFESSLGLLSTGQWLSIPFIIVGFYLWFTAKKRPYTTV
ncbi:prolipoprotein diacylglyceryl transferase [Flavobacterium sp. xlx-214]|uniref:prolipoprotein diacylglyceryl transferase n=1 Tax=unclassified Flavobacterium TaxID=196869 RepID=UPI0013D6AB45|nr:MULTISPECIES: prolipoprotein diacylglyceryl transferase [unclassified Flavobacterium]MBA5793801.1 prolipoprotein diacylglyceryl transferase [Flavobacterium sp. xlx-221]QMI82289.1 prolipoprotein diacylglyceryl transferase [Flavobacterium sp. xlx-214]